MELCLNGLFVFVNRKSWRLLFVLVSLTFLSLFESPSTFVVTHCHPYVCLFVCWLVCHPTRSNSKIKFDNKVSDQPGQILSNMQLCWRLLTIAPLSSGNWLKSNVVCKAFYSFQYIILYKNVNILVFRLAASAQKGLAATEQNTLVCFRRINFTKCKFLTGVFPFYLLFAGVHGDGRWSDSGAEHDTVFGEKSFHIWFQRLIHS